MLVIIKQTTTSLLFLLSGLFIALLATTVLAASDKAATKAVKASSNTEQYRERMRKNDKQYWENFNSLDDDEKLTRVGKVSDRLHQIMDRADEIKNETNNSEDGSTNLLQSMCVQKSYDTIVKAVNNGSILALDLQRAVKSGNSGKQASKRSLLDAALSGAESAVMTLGNCSTGLSADGETQVDVDTPDDAQKDKKEPDQTVTIENPPNASPFQ